MMLERVKKRINALIWGIESVNCAECGSSVSPAKAVWSGRDAYCSIEHELRDREVPRWAPPSHAEARARTVDVAPVYRQAA
ncbi:MAG: hypothetical protein ABS64_06460 [Microbacterium sp. SCN 69-37]|nr:MAG: hypothetical protein ABS64_06460 [Microbacterium sp. SCN 69-37]